MISVTNDKGNTIEVPFEISEVLKDEGFTLREPERFDFTSKKPIFTTIQFSTGVWIKIRQGQMSQPEFLEYYPKDSKVATIVYSIKKTKHSHFDNQ